MGWIALVHAFVFCMCLQHISVCSEPPALTLVFSSRLVVVVVVVVVRGRVEWEPQESFMAAAPETTCSQAPLFWHFFMTS